MLNCRLSGDSILGKVVLVGACLCIVAVLATPSGASFNLGRLTKSDSEKILFNEVFIGVGYVDTPFDWVLQQKHEAEALDAVRSTLVRTAKVQALPILVVGAESSSPDRIEAFIDVTCEVQDTGSDSPTPIGRCYTIRLGAPWTHENLLMSIVALSSLSTTNRRIHAVDLEAFRAALSKTMLQFKGLVQHFDPIWSPNGRWLLYTVWEDSQVGFTLLDPSPRAVRRLPPLQGDMVTRPLWSPDSRFVAYASRAELVVYDTQTGTEGRLLPTAVNQPQFFAPALAFVGRELRILLPSWEYAYDLDRHEVRVVRMGRQHPQWPSQGASVDPVKAHFSLAPVVSPTGRYVATIILVDGRRVLEVAPR